MEIMNIENIDDNKKIIDTENEESGDLLNINKENIDTNTIKIIPYFLSTYCLFFLIIFFVLFFFIIPQYHSSKLFRSKNTNISFNKNYIPKILFHLTDIHVSHNLPGKNNGSHIFLKSFIEYKPDLILTTGDIADDFEGNHKWQRVGSPWLEDWVIYNNTVKKILSKYPVIDVAGNHDVWGLDSATSNSNYFLDYSFIYNRTNVKSYDDFIIKKVKNLNLTFILFNDFRFPNPHPPYGLDTHTNKHQLNLLEDMIDNLEEEECYILTHYNIDRVSLIKSDKGHSFKEIISKKKVAGIFSGHYHPKTVSIIHHGEEGGLEYCTPSCYDNKRAGLITIDNNNLIYHDTYIPSYDKRPLFFMTYPVPVEQVSNHHIFNLNNFEIRVLSYIIDKNVTLKVEGDINNKLDYVMTLNNKAILYSLPVNLANGLYKIHIYDEDRKLCDISRNFVVGDNYEGQKEKAINNPRAFFVLRFSTIPMLIILFIIILPFNFGKNFKIVTKIENFIKGENYEDIHIVLKYFYLIILSPFILRMRFSKLNKICKYGVFILALYPIFLPIHFFNRINGKFGFSFNVFIVIGTYIQYESWALQMSYIYYLCIIFPNVFYLTGFEQYLKKDKKSKIIFFSNLIFSYVLYAGALTINFRLMPQSISFGYSFISPYIITFIIMKIVVHKFCYEEKRIEKEENGSIN